MHENTNSYNIKGVLYIESDSRCQGIRRSFVLRGTRYRKLNTWLPFTTQSRSKEFACVLEVTVFIGPLSNKSKLDINAENS